MSEGTKAIQVHGGRRPGSGPKPKLATQTREAEELAAKIYRFRQLSLDKLAEKGPELMALAIRTAQGAFSDDGKPNVPMLRTLLELLVKVGAPIEEGGNAPIAELLHNLRANVANIQINIRDSVEADGGGRTATPDEPQQQTRATMA